MILYVDNEHSSVYERPKTDRLGAARLRITYRLQDLTDDVCLVQRYPDVSPALIERYDIRAVFISGHGAPPDLFDEADRTGLREVVRTGTTPVFGFCGGLQFIAQTLGVDIRRIGPIPDGVEDPVPAYEPGWLKEVGYEPVHIVADHPLVAGLGPDPVFRHAHTWELAEAPEGFDVLASTELTRIQLAAHRDLPLAGSQFHPEYWTDDAPAGRTLIDNFCRWVGL